MSLTNTEIYLIVVLAVLALFTLHLHVQLTKASRILKIFMHTIDLAADGKGEFTRNKKGTPQFKQTKE